MAHGKVSRKKNRDQNLAKKKARREANQTKWQAMAAEGKNKKSKRSTLSGRRKRHSITKHMHPNGFGCGNLACYHCYPPLDKNGKKIPKGPAFQPPKPNQHLRRYLRRTTERMFAAAEVISKISGTDFLRS